MGEEQTKPHSSLYSHCYCTFFHDNVLPIDGRVVFSCVSFFFFHFSELLIFF